MFDIGWSELLVIGALALIVVGPKELPRMLRTLGQYAGKARSMAREFQRSMNDAAREADLSELRDIKSSVESSLPDFSKRIGLDAPKTFEEAAKKNSAREAKTADAAEPEVKPELKPEAKATETAKPVAAEKVAGSDGEATDTAAKSA